MAQNIAVYSAGVIARLRLADSILGSVATLVDGPVVAGVTIRDGGALYGYTLLPDGAVAETGVALVPASETTASPDVAEPVQAAARAIGRPAKGIHRFDHALACRLRAECISYERLADYFNVSRNTIMRATKHIFTDRRRAPAKFDFDRIRALRLHAEGVGVKEIGRAVRASADSVRGFLARVLTVTVTEA